MPMLDIVAAACSRVLNLVREQPPARAEGEHRLTLDRPLTVASVMTSPAVTCNPETTLGEVAQLMWTHDLGFLPVVARDTGELVGVITDRDALMGAWTQGKPLWDVPVSVSMERSVKTCRPDMPIAEAEEILGLSQLHRLPVVDGEGRLVAVLSLQDLARKATRTGDAAMACDVAVVLSAICSPRVGPPAILH